MKNDRLRSVVASALMTALVLMMTMVLRVPSPTQGYMNMGDAAVLLSAWLLGPWWGAAAAGIGSGLADLLSGAAYYLPGTLIIKAGMAVIAGLLTRSMRRQSRTSFWPHFFGGLAAELFMVAGYFGYSYLLLGKTLTPALLAALGNLTQGGVCLVLALLLKAGFYAVYKRE